MSEGRTAFGFDGPTHRYAVPIDRAVLESAIEKLREGPIAQGCWPHVVSPAEAARGGMARCAACFQVVDIDAIRALGGGKP